MLVEINLLHLLLHHTGCKFCWKPLHGFDSAGCEGHCQASAHKVSLPLGFSQDTESCSHCCADEAMNSLHHSEASALVDPSGGFPCGNLEHVTETEASGLFGHTVLVG